MRVEPRGIGRKAPEQLPASDTWEIVMGRVDLRPDVGWREQFSAWTAIARCVEIPYRGQLRLISAHFVAHSVEALRLYRKGWTDYTAAYLGHLAERLAATKTPDDALAILRHAGRQLGVEDLPDLPSEEQIRDAVIRVTTRNGGPTVPFPGDADAGTGSESSAASGEPTMASPAADGTGLDSAPGGTGPGGDTAGPASPVAVVAEVAEVQRAPAGPLPIWTEQEVRDLGFLTARTLARKRAPAAATWGDVLTALVGTERDPSETA